MLKFFAPDVKDHAKGVNLVVLNDYINIRRLGKKKINWSLLLNSIDFNIWYEMLSIFMAPPIWDQMYVVSALAKSCSWTIERAAK